MIGCLRTRVRKQPIIALYYESENELKFNYFEALSHLIGSCLVSVHRLPKKISRQEKQTTKFLTGGKYWCQSVYSIVFNFNADATGVLLRRIIINFNLLRI